MAPKKRRWLRWLLLSLLILALLLWGASILIQRWLRSTGLPQREGSATLAGLEAPVEVRFDGAGVPCVRAGSLEDLFATVGWLHANDRMTQLELGRRVAAGRLAEIVGPAAVPSDAQSRELLLHRTAEGYLEACGVEGRAALEAYARGVNAWLEARGSDLPPGLVLLGVEPEPWRPVDCMGTVLLMARDLSMLMAPDQDRTRTLVGLGEEGLAGLYGVEELRVSEALRAFVQAEREERARSEAEPADGGEKRQGGSNAWAVGAGRSASGHPLVANDPHLGLMLPSLWYQMSLRCPGYEAAGMTLVGAPPIIIGQGPEIAWAVTNSGLDNNDLFIEELEGTDRVVRGEGTAPIERWSETIEVRGGPAVTIELAATDLGPLLEGFGPEGTRLSLAWSAHEPFDPIAPFLGLARARSLAEVRPAIAGYVCPAQNLIVAHRDGGILQTVLGRAPDRGAGDGRLFEPGADPAHRWSGHLPAGEQPALENPPDDLLASANDDVGLPGGAALDVPHRARRARALLAERADWTPGGFASLQTDAVSLYALEVVAALGGDWSGDAGEALEHLRGWDGGMTVDSSPAALFAHLHEELHERIFGDELEAEDLSAGFRYHRRHRLLRALRGEVEERWFDDVSTEEVEGRRATLERALVEAWRATSKRFRGADPSRWRYGELHTWAPMHPLVRLPLIGRKYSRDPIPLDGSSTCLSAFAGYERVSFGPSMRWVADTGDPDRSLACLPGGQSGHPFDPHYADQLELFARGEMRPVPWSEEAIEAGAASRLVLEP